MAGSGRRRLVAVLLATILCAADGRPLSGALPGQSGRAGQTLAGEERLLGAYQGVLPCADCSGIRTVVALYARSAVEPGDGTFTLEQTYLKTPDGDRTFASAGRWNILRGNEADPDATIYQLNAEAGRQPLYLLRLSPQRLEMLDRQQRRIQSPANYTLTRMQAARSVGSYVPISAGGAEAVEAAEFAVREQQRRGRQPIQLQRVRRAERQVVAGLNFRLCLDVLADRKEASVLAVVYRNVRQQFSLTEWTPSACK
jgi:uncharacterized lipoprotein NlpE involved in copper resistance